MCGIVGIAVGNNSKISQESFKKSLNSLLLYSETRGKDAAGIAVLCGDKIEVFKDSVRASKLIKGGKYQEIFDNVFSRSMKDGKSTRPLAAIGHTRMATNGSFVSNFDNQPVIKDGLVGVHNGIVVNDKKLWEKYPQLKREFEVDTEVILSLIKMFLNENKDLAESIKSVFKLIEGSASVAALFNDRNYLALATNTGSLYLCEDERNSIIIFASELFILKKLIEKHGDQISLDGSKIRQIRSGTGLLVDLNGLDAKEFVFNKAENVSIDKLSYDRTIVDLSRGESQKKDIPITATKDHSMLDFIASQNALFDKMAESVAKLKRCTKCILPETMPFIEFDENGVCNYCRNYKKIEVKGKNNLEKFVEKNRSKDGSPDCLVAFSGGRDSSFGLHYIKKVLGMHPVAYSYDWGMITDLGRRNQARMCGKLGVEHIIVSADIRKKRENIRKNVKAWLKSPNLGTIPLFMAGDKHYFYYANKLQKQLNVNSIVMCENLLERTHFKHGFCGVKNMRSDVSPYIMSDSNKAKMQLYYLKQLFLNPSYINSSIFDTLAGFVSYYMMPHNFLYLFQYIKWNEAEINNTLINEYNWELSPDTSSTWRIGDGTAAFYNYIYYTVAGFTEHDAFLSNSIREGSIERSRAIILASESNRPRYDSIKWYCDIIGIDFMDTLRTIDSIPKLVP